MIIHTVNCITPDGASQQPITAIVDRVWKARGGDEYTCGNVTFRRLGPLGITYAPETEGWDVDAMIEALRVEIVQRGL
jgi:hypothetical protein